MLTTVVEGRVYDWSHSVGRNAAAGNGFTYPCSIALASQGVAYVVNRGGEGNQGSRVSKVSIGAPGDETVLGEFCRYGTSPGQGMWLNSVALDKQGNAYVSDDWLNRISVFDRRRQLRERVGYYWVGSGTARWACWSGVRSGRQPLRGR